MQTPNGRTAIRIFLRPSGRGKVCTSGLEFKTALANRAVTPYYLRDHGPAISHRGDGCLYHEDANLPGYCLYDDLWIHSALASLLRGDTPGTTRLYVLGLAQRSAVRNGPADVY